MRAIILAAGQGTRLGNLTASTPKCLVKLNDTPIIKLQMDLWKDLGINDFSIIIGSKGDCWTQESYNAIRGHCSEVIINFDNDITQNSFSLFLALKDHYDEDVLFFDGDIVLKSEAAQEIINCTYDNFIVTKISSDKAEPGNRVESDKNNVVLDIGKTIQPNQNPWTIYGGMGKINKNLIEQMKSILAIDKYRDEDVGSPLKMFSSEHRLNNLIINDGWINVNTIIDMKNANEIIGI